MKTKIIANYLPQYHRIPENDKWWGEGYTDWTAVRNSVPLFKKHEQPNVPLGNNYYSLDDVNVIKWQAQMARENGIFGFGIYHYWFSDEMCLLDKPAELIRTHQEISINYMFIWDNASWKRTWSAVKGPANAWAPKYENNKKEGDIDNGILAELKYGSEESWRKHYDYLEPYFRDERYVKINGCPVFAFFNPDNCPDVIKQMVAFWNDLAKKSGFNGIVCIGKYKGSKSDYLDYSFTYQPEWTAWKNRNFFYRAMDYLRKKYIKTKKPVIYDYDKVWKKIIAEAENDMVECHLYTAFVRYDDTPRRGGKGKVIIGGTPQKFGEYFNKLMKICEQKNKEFLFITAWNEWGEGAYLEPDVRSGNQYLNQIRKFVTK